MRTWVWLPIAAVCLAGPVADVAQAAEKPAVLFCSARGLSQAGVDLTYMKELHAKGYPVDYTESLSEVTADRIKRFNVLVIYGTHVSEAFTQMIGAYVRQGGGVLLIPGHTSWGSRLDLAGKGLTELLDVKLVYESIKETDEAKTGRMTHASYPVLLNFTTSIAKTPVSDGVSQLWYSPRAMPIIPGRDWQVVVRASKTARTALHPWLQRYTKAEQARLLHRDEPVAAPPLFAIRTYGKGRVALLHDWRQFTVGAGTKFIYNREVLSKGLKGKPSHFARLLENTYNWLAQPSMKERTLGGYKTTPEDLVPENLRPHAKSQFEYTFQYWEYEVKQWHRPPKFAPVFKGLIGARTALSTGKGTVADYAAAARKAGLDFVVFLEDYAKLTADEFKALDLACRKHTDKRLALLPGIAIETDMGPKLFVFGLNGIYPPADIFAGSTKRIALQPTDEQGRFTGYNGPSFSWMLHFARVDRNLGFYHFTADPQGIQVWDLRCYSMAAMRYYRKGKLVEDVTDQYALTHAGTLGPQPCAINEVYSPEELVREVGGGNALTYAQTRGTGTLMQDALRWNSQYDGLNVFCSDGPIIHAWPMCYRVMTMGAENFVVTPNVMASKLHVSSPQGLKEIRIYNGPDLFRRLACNGARQFGGTLVLNGEVHKNLAIVVEDTAGGKAVGMARRCWATRGRSVVFCGDHVNDCKSGGMFLGRGPNTMIAHWAPPLAEQVAGFTWDGGPPPSLPLVYMNESRPVLVSDAGREDGTRFAQIPLNEYSDGGCVAVTSIQDRIFSDKLIRVVNPWHTFGPIAGPPKLMTFRLRAREWNQPTVGTPEYGWAGPGVYDDCNAFLFRSEITFKRKQTLTSLRLMRNQHAVPDVPIRFAWGRRPGQAEKVVTLEDGTILNVDLAPGDWFAYFSPKLASTHVFINRLVPVRLTVRGRTYMVVDANVKGRTVKAGETFNWELFSVASPLTVEITKVEQVTRLLSYLAEPTGMKIVRGKRVASPGLVDLTASGGAVELSVPRPAQPTRLTLPVRIRGLNPNWSAGLYLVKGYVKGTYGRGENRYRPLGVTQDGHAHVPLFVDRAERTHVVAGHPVVAGPEGTDLFIQVTLLTEEPRQWHVAVNNPTDKPITTQLTTAIALPNLVLPEGKVTFAPGEHRVLR